MKIIFDNIIYYLQRSGGGSVYWYEITKDYIDSDMALFVEPKCEGKNIFRKNIKFKNLEILKGLPLKVSRYLPVAISKDKYIFHSSYYRYSRDKDALNITTVHDFTYEYFIKGIPGIIHKWQKKKALQKSKGIICISENTKRDLLKFYPWASEKEIAVINNGVSDIFKDIKSEYNTESSRFKDILNSEYVLYVGHRTSYKNFDIAAKSVALLKKEVKFVIVGQELKAEEEVFLKKILPDRYIHLKNISSDELNIIFNYALCLLYPSSYEGFGIPIIEAMSAGCPVVAAKLSSIPDVAGDAALLVEKVEEHRFKYEIESLFDKAKRDEMIKKGLENAKKYSWRKCRKETLEFYKYIYNKFGGENEKGAE